MAMFLLIYIVPQSGYNCLARYPSYESLFARSTNSLRELRLICKSNWGNVSLLSACSHLVFKYEFLDAIFLYARHTWISQFAHPHIYWAVNKFLKSSLAVNLLPFPLLGGSQRNIP